MTLKQLVRVLNQYDAELEQRCDVVARRHLGISPFTDSYGQLQHARWMCQEVLQFLPKHKPGELPPDVEEAQKAIEKAMRWLGFIQGVLWSTRTRSIDEMRKDNTA